jgi:hypothetical protein
MLHLMVCLGPEFNLSPIFYGQHPLLLVHKDRLLEVSRRRTSRSLSGVRQADYREHGAGWLARGPQLMIGFFNPRLDEALKLGDARSGERGRVT